MQLALSLNTLHSILFSSMDQGFCFFLILYSRDQGYLNKVSVKIYLTFNHDQTQEEQEMASVHFSS